MWLTSLFKRKKKKKSYTPPIYIRTDEQEEYRAKVREAFGSVKYKDEYEVEFIDKQCMAITKRGNRCKNKALENDTYCYRHRALHE